MDTNITTKKKAFLLLACVWFIITFSVIQTTYAKYVTNLNANANIAISYWNILVNDQDIVNNHDISEAMANTLVLPSNEYTKPNVIVPGSTGYFDLSIDSSKVTVPFTVTVNTSINEASSLTTDFVVSGYSLDGGTTIVDLTTADDTSQNATNNETNNDVTTFSVNVAADVDSTVIKIYTTWLDDGLDSAEDTALGISGGTAILDVNLRFEQIV